jgi:glycosyltransferase involved in cell wall biosynthesis
VRSPAISVVIPVRNMERFLGEAIESALAQSLAPHEVLVVDDGSTDGSAALAKSFGPPARVIRCEPRGVSAARNTGVRESSGELIAFLDADDAMKPDRLERQAAALAKPGVDFVLGREELLLEPGVELPELVSCKLAPVAEGVTPYPMTTLAVRREAFQRAGPYEESLPLGEDVDWFLRAIDEGLTYELLEDVLIVRRYHGANATYDQAGERRALFQVMRRRAARRRAAAEN